MAPSDAQNTPPESAQKHLEEARSPLLRWHCQEEDPIERQLLLEPPKQVWPKGAAYLRKEIAPDDYKGHIETVYSLNKDKQKVAQFEESPTKLLELLLRSRARRAEAEKIANKAVAKWRLKKERLKLDTALESFHTRVSIWRTLVVLYGVRECQMENGSRRMRHTRVLVFAIVRTEQQQSETKLTYSHYRAQDQM